MQSHDRLLALDGLRAVSILIVALSHTLLLAGITFIPGGFGVTVFFFISGFIITRLLLQESVRTGDIRLSSFYVRRFFRLTPALLVYVAISILVLLSLGLAIPSSDIAASLFYYANYHAIYRGFTVMGGDGVLSPLAITWSLAIEEHFYFLFPVCLLMLRRKTKRLSILLAIFVVMVAAWRTFLVLHIGENVLPAYRIYMASDTRLDSIAYGCLLSVLFYRASEERDRRAHWLLEKLQGHGGLCFCAVLILVSFLVRGPEFRDTLRYSIQGIALIPLFCSLFWQARAPRWLKLALENRVMVFIGAISYSLYLYHFLALAVAQRSFQAMAPVGQVAFTWLIALLGSVGSYYFIEGPARRLGSMVASRLRPQTAALRAR